MAKQKAYVRTGIAPGALNAWGVFADGTVHIVAHNFSPDGGQPVPNADAIQSARPASLANLPGARAAQLLHSFGAGFDGQKHVTALASMLTGKGYQIVPSREGDASLATLRSVRGNGYFYLQTHGGLMYYVDPDKQKDTSEYVFALQSSTLVDQKAATSAAIRDDLANRRLNWFTASTGEKIEVDGKIVDKKETRYGINYRFVERYWEFEPNSVVVIFACNSATVLVPDEPATVSAEMFIAACHRKGAGVYVGWTEVVSAQGGDAIEYYTDRLLGANKVKPEPWKQRAFPSEEVLADMDRKGIRRDADHGALLVARRNPNTRADAILAPSIRHLEVDESRSELALVGLFGDQEGTVSVGGQEAAILEWKPDKVRVRLAPPGQDGAHGPVVAKVFEHSSNTRWLSMWQPQLKYTWVETSRSTLRVDGDAHLYFRGDVGRVRDKPGESPRRPERFAAAATLSTFMTQASGSFAHPGGVCVDTWSGRMDFPVAYPIVAPGLLNGLRLNGAQGTGALGLAIAALTPALRESSTCGGGGTFVPAWDDFDGAASFPLGGIEGQPVIELPALQFSISSTDFVVPKRNYTGSDGVSVQWEKFVPSFVPTDDDAV